MKHRIITIVALLVMMVTFTGLASALATDWQLKDGTTKAIFYMKNDSSLTLDMIFKNFADRDEGTTGNVILGFLFCTNENNQVNVNCDPNDLLLQLRLNQVTATRTPLWPNMLVPDEVTVNMHAPVSRKPGTLYSFEGTVAPFADPGTTAGVSLRVGLLGGSITGKKCNDLNSDGICGQAEPGLAGWTIILRDENGTEVNRTTTDASGNYAFRGPFAEGQFLGLRGTFTVEEVPQAGWTQTGPPAPGTYTVTIDANDATDLNFANTPVVEECPGGKCKVVGWGTLGPKATPELTFKIFAFTSFMPKGTVEAEDDAGNKIKATEINSVITKKNVDPMTGEIKGKAMFNNEGPYDFVVKVEDGGQPTYAPYVGKDTFDISISAKNYHKSGTLTSGDLQVIY